MCNSYGRYNLNFYMYVIVIVFNCTMHMHRLYTNNNNSDRIRKEKTIYRQTKEKKNEEGWLLNGNTSFLDSFPFSKF